MWRVLLLVLATAGLLAVAGCGSSTSDESGTPAAETSASAGASPGAVVAADLGEAVTVGPLKITPTRLQQPSATPDPVYPDAPKNGTFCSVFMRWENVGDETLTDFPFSIMVNSDAESFRITMAEGPSPSLAEDWTELAPKAVIEGWLTFDMAGDPAKLVITWQTDEPSAEAVGTWMIK